MDAAVLGGLAEQWVWRCQMVATDFQLGRPFDFSREVEKLVRQAETQARLLDDGLLLLVKVEDRLAMSAHMARGRTPPCLGQDGDPTNVSSRADALHAIADAFGGAIRRLKLVEV